jgi:ureidoacrylate peracid hydrolase
MPRVTIVFLHIQGRLKVAEKRIDTSVAAEVLLMYSHGIPDEFNRRRKMIVDRTVPWRIKGERCALLVIDMQNDFVKPGGILYHNDVPMRAAPNMKRLSDACRALSIPVIYTKAMLDERFAISPLEASLAPVLFEKGLRGGTWGAEIIDELTPEPGDPVVVKHRYDAFYNTNLEVLLNNIRGPGAVDTVLITGTVTNVCCESTARGAFMRDYKVVFVGDACGAFDEDAHRATLRTIGRFFGRVLDADQVIAALKDGEEDVASVLE